MKSMLLSVKLADAKTPLERVKLFKKHFDEGWDGLLANGSQETVLRLNNLNDSYEIILNSADPEKAAAEFEADQ